MKFFDFINKAQIKAAKRISSALHSDTTETATTINVNGAEGTKEEKEEEAVVCEDFFHVIQQAKDVGISSSDCSNIWW